MDLDVRNGFRLRGRAMSRLETFADASFAFALTLLVISVDEIPGSYDELVDALRSVPAFLASFLQLAMFWMGHREWTRQYGLDDTTTLWLTLLLIAGVLIMVYPLKVMVAATFAYLTGGWAPGPFEITSYDQVRGIFALFGVSFFALSAIILLLFAHAYRRREALALSPFERHETLTSVFGWCILSGVGLLSVLLALLLPQQHIQLAGWCYALLGVLMPGLDFWRHRSRPVS